MAMKYSTTAATQASNTSLGKVDIFLPWRNPDNVISFETFVLIERVLFCYVNPLTFCIGVPSNVLNCVVFVKQGLKDRMNLCLFCLSAVDLLFVALFFTSGSHCWVELFRPDLALWWKYSTQKYVLGLYRGFLLCSGCLTMIISVERCVCVFLPLKAASLMKTRTMALLITGTVVLIHLLCVVYPLKVDARPVTNPLTNRTDIQLVLSALYFQNPVVFDVIQNTIAMNSIPLLSFIVVAVSTTITVVQLKRMIVWRENVSSANMKNAFSSQQIALVKMLVVVCVIFILTSSPFVALSITSSVEPEFFLNRRYTNIFLASHALHLGLGMLNSSINFFVYLQRSSRFRRELKSVMGLGVCFDKIVDANLVTSDSYVAGTEQTQ